MARFETLHAIRVVAKPAVIDALVGDPGGLGMGSTVLRFAPDDLFIIGQLGILEVSDQHAIIETELGFSGRWFTRSEFDSTVRAHMEWPLPANGNLGQGLIAGVAAKVHVEDKTVLVLCPTSFAHELEGRLV